MPPRRERRVAFRTLLIVGEGFSEVAFLNHMKAEYLARGSGLRVQVKNAYGYGGHHVLERAMRFRKAGAFDQVAIMVDVDQHWSPKDREKARAQRIACLESKPCIEALLLRVAGHTPGADPGALKAQFERAFGGPANDEQVYRRHFTRSMIEHSRQTVEPLEQLISLLSNDPRKPD